MEDFTKELNQHSPINSNPAIVTQTKWLTKNRLWNLIFLFTFPLGIFFSALMWSLPMLLIPLAILIFVFKFAPTDAGTITPAEARKDPFAKAACGIWFATAIAFGFAGSKILALIGLKIGQFGFAEVAFFIFLIPISILCYANIPLSSCVEATDPSELRRGGSSFKSSFKSSLSRHQNDHHRRLTSDPSYRNLAGNIYHR